ncbi:MAG: 30S ribosomal protein S4 [Patescibacteria group bacterium]
MGKYLGPKCKLCRREGRKLFLKGDLCYSVKCPFAKRKYAPGVHGNKRQDKLSEYGKQLREKQKARRIYHLQEKQFSNIFVTASAKQGDAGENLLQALELRLDNVIYRAGFTPSRDAARQLVNHAHFRVNDKKNSIASCAMKVGDKITVKVTSKSKAEIEERVKSNVKNTEIPTWLNVNVKDLSIEILARPIGVELPQDIDTKLIVEYYSR